MSEVTPSQTIGPFFHGALLLEPGEAPLPDAPTGRRLRIEGTVRDGEGAPVGDALIETWQAGCTGGRFGRVATDASGRFVLETEPLAALATPHAPHLMVSLFARGVLTRLVTRIYLEGESANAQDPTLARVPSPRRQTLLARRIEPDRYGFDIVLQGPGETVFFDG